MRTAEGYLNKLKGIYEIRNKITQKVYIGSTKNSFQSRWTEHKRLLRQGKHHSPYLQNTWNMYGEDNFDFNILEVLESNDKNYFLEREQHYIDYYIFNKIKIYNVLYSTSGGSEYHDDYEIYKVDSLTGEIIELIDMFKLMKEYDFKDRGEIVKTCKLTFDKRYDLKTYYRFKGYYYVFKDNYENWKIDFFNERSFVCVYDLKGILINYFFDMGDCVSSYNIPRDTIGQCLTQNNSNPKVLYQRHGYIFIRKPFKEISKSINTGIKFLEVYNAKTLEFLEEYKEHSLYATKNNILKQSVAYYAKTGKVLKSLNVILKYKTY